LDSYAQQEAQMLQYLATVRLGDSNDHIVTNKVVTIPEIAILRRVHGGDSAVMVTGRVAEPATTEGRPRTDGQERERLRLIYDAATSDQEPMVDRIFGGSMTPLPTRLSQIGIDPAAQADALRRQAAAMTSAATALAEDVDDAPPEDVDEMFGDEQAAA
jgi:hypothetical protein